MKQEIGGFLFCLFSILATEAGATTTKGWSEPWHSIEDEMRRAGCFDPPIVTVRDVLRSGDSLCKWRAIQVLGMRGEKEAASDLKAIVEHDPDAIARRRAAVALVQLGESAYFDVLRREMELGSTLEERVSIAGALAEVGEASGFRYLEEACRSSEPKNRRSCVLKLGSFQALAEQDEQMLMALVDLTLTLAEDSDSWIRQSATSFLGGWGVGVSLPKQAVSRLEELAESSPDPEVRRTAQMTVDHQKERSREPNKAWEKSWRIHLLGVRGDKKAIPKLKEIFESDPDLKFRVDAAIVLVRLGERSYLSFVRKAMEEGLDERLPLAGELADLGDFSGYGYVEEACRSSNVESRRGCAALLFHFNLAAKQDARFFATLVDQVIDLTGDSDSQVRELAIADLEMYGRDWELPESAIAKLEKLATTAANPKVREVAQTAVKKQKGKQRKLEEPKKL